MTTTPKVTITQAVQLLGEWAAMSRAEVDCHRFVMTDYLERVRREEAEQRELARVASLCLPTAAHIERALAEATRREALGMTRVDALRSVGDDLVPARWARDHDIAPQIT